MRAWQWLQLQCSRWKLVEMMINTVCVHLVNHTVYLFIFLVKWRILIQKIWKCTIDNFFYILCLYFWDDKYIKLELSKQISSARAGCLVSGNAKSELGRVSSFLNRLRNSQPDSRSPDRTVFFLFFIFANIFFIFCFLT